MHYSSKPQRMNGKALNRNCQIAPAYNSGIHFLSPPNVSTSGQLQINRKYINNMGNINEVSVLQYQRTTNMLMKNHNMHEINHFHNMRPQQPQAFVYKATQFHNHINPSIPQKYSVNQPMQRKLIKEEALPPADNSQKPPENVGFSIKVANQLVNQHELNKTNNTEKVNTKDSMNSPTEVIHNRKISLEVNCKQHEEVSIDVPKATEDEVKDNNCKAEVQKDMEQVLNINNEHSDKDRSDEVNDKATKDSREKTPMCLINDLARFNKISFQYRLTGENGPAHCKRFTVTLKLGDEEYTAEGFKIKKAQHLAAKEAIEKTKYKHPTPKTNDILKSNITPTVELNALAMKLGQQTYYIFDSQQIGTYSNYKYNWHSFEKNKVTTEETPVGMVEHVINSGKQFITNNHKRHFLSKFQNRNITFQNSLQNTPFPTSRTYFSSTPCKITLLVGTKQFVGVGKTLQQAKHDAASNALQVLKEQMRNEHLETHDETVEDNENKSPISLVFEMGIKRNLPVDFKVLREEGPAHMRTFITACTVGDIETEGKGNGKKISKKKAAQKMLEELKKLPPITPATSPAKRVKLKIPKKKYNDQSRNDNIVGHEKERQNTYRKKLTTHSEADNPINKLLEWHQNEKKEEPVFKLINEFGKENSHRRQFVMEVSSNKVMARGVGSSKKMAKQEAAKKCLAVIMESEQCIDTPDKNDIMKVNNTSEKKEVVAEVTTHKPLHEHNCKSIPNNNELCQERTGVDKTANSASSTSSTNATNNSSKSKNLHMKDQLLYLSKLLGFDVEFSDYPKGNHNEFLTIVMLSTNPPQICHGVGVNAKESQEDAARNALKILSEMGLNNINA